MKRKLHRWLEVERGVQWCRRCGVKKSIEAGIMVFTQKDGKREYKLLTPPCIGTL